MISFAEVIEKTEPSAGDVHATAALGKPRRSRGQLFSTITRDDPRFVARVPSTSGPTPVITATSKRYSAVADLPKPVRDRYKNKPKKLRQWMHVWNSAYDAHGSEDRAFASAWAAVQKTDDCDVTLNTPLLIRLLEYAREEAPNDEALHNVAERLIGSAASGAPVRMEAYQHLVKRLTTPTSPPFPYDPSFLSRLHGPQVRSFLWAVTHRKDLPKVRVPLDHLVAIQDRVMTKAQVLAKKKPVVVRLHGVNYIADGHHRLSARLMAGKSDAKVRLYDLDGPSLEKAASPAWSAPFRVEKADPDKQQLFGWASVVTKGGRAVVDKQGDIIPVDELERAAYDFVLESRQQGDMHVRKTGVGRLIESMVFTNEKQKALGIDLGMEAWWVGFLCDCKELWKDVKGGKKLEFSIGGSAISEKVDA